MRGKKGDNEGGRGTMRGKKGDNEREEGGQ